tara:strand:- start:119981 stop:120244 length:264 start_codon:yes stop_codon:yes gene_type:complete
LVDTFRQRLAALAHWYIGHGFSDPPKALVVRKDSVASYSEKSSVSSMGRWGTGRGLACQNILSPQADGNGMSSLRDRRDKANVFRRT